MDPSYTQSNESEVQKFNLGIAKELDKYGVEKCTINHITSEKVKYQLNATDVLVIYGEMSGVDINSDVIDVVDHAKEKLTTILPVAINKKCRDSLNFTLKNQCYDVEEELRKRNLGLDYIETIAVIFSRKIFSKVLPSMYSETGRIFLSHRRYDGEEIAAKLCDKIKLGYTNSTVFRDVTEVDVGEEAQEEIDKAMSHCDAFVFLHTPEAHNSEWIKKELMFAIIRHIPVLWVNIDNASVDGIPFLPTEKPHLEYQSEDFRCQESLVKISDEIINKTFELIITFNNDLYGNIDRLKKMETVKIEDIPNTHMMYWFNLDRRGYKYPQRNINHVVQFLGRTHNENDINKISSMITDGTDSAIIVSNKVVKSKEKNGLVIESMQHFFDEWDRYIKGNTKCNGKEIIISGAFPESDEIFKQTLTDALLIFAREVLKSGYILTFGAHPTFQEMFFELSRDMSFDNSQLRLKMFISKFFEESYSSKRERFKDFALLIEQEKRIDISTSLTLMRKAMIDRDDVAGVICLGGKCKENPNEEGVREEIDIAKNRGIPVYIVGTVGGCSSVIASEYENDMWSGLNRSPRELNKRLKDSLDYSSLAFDVLKDISTRSE